MTFQYDGDLKIATFYPLTQFTKFPRRPSLRSARRPKPEPPYFLKTIGDCEVFPGMQGKFTACVAGTPEPDFEWYRDDMRMFPRWVPRHTCLYIFSAHVKISDPGHSRSGHQVMSSDFTSEKA